MSKENKNVKKFDMIEFVGFAVDEIQSLSEALNDTMSKLDRDRQNRKKKEDK
tara:strand:+ start:2883 stop:3038 length:156 start_codon:yes stop_codon:yes gene_type:complete